MSENMQTLKDLVEQRFKDTEFKDNSKYRKRLNYELIEVETQNCADYFLEIYQSNKKYKNENNLLIPHLLGICDDFSIDQMPKIKTNEFKLLGMNTDVWYGCFGCQSFINHNFLLALENKYALTNMITNVLCRKDRCCLERIMGCIFFTDNFFP